MSRTFFAVPYGALAVWTGYLLNLHAEFEQLWCLEQIRISKGIK
jgi:hypothetical protein